MKIMYTGTADFKGFSSEDFGRVGVQSEDIMFARNEPTEVPGPVGDALLDDQNIFGLEPFEEVTDEDFNTTVQEVPEGAPSEDLRPADQPTLSFDADEADDEQPESEADLGESDDHPQQGVDGDSPNFTTT